MNIKPKKEFRDPIHGFIPIYDQEYDIIQDPVFQRLRRIKQLSFGNWVYHGAEHSRFGHVIGVMHLVEKALNKIQDNAEKLKTKVDITEDDIKLARLSALLHDVGHHPFSHALDQADVNLENHVKYSIKLVENHFEKYLKDANVKTEDITKLILGTPHPEKPFLTDLIHSQIDMDRCDYLLRDSHYAGVKYGIYDLDRLLDSLYVTEDNNQLVILNKGFFSAEQFVLARYHMFSQIYLHHTKRCFESLAKLACEHLFREGKFEYPSLDDLDEPKNIEKFISLDDAWLLNQITNITTSGMENISKSIKLRIPYTVALDSDQIELKLRKNSTAQDGSSYLKSIEESLEYEMEHTDNLKKKGIEKEDIFFDEAKKLSYKLRPYYLTKDADNPQTIYIYDEDSGKEAFELRSKLIKILGEPVKIRRTYVRKEKKDDLMEYLIGKHPAIK